MNTLVSMFVLFCLVFVSAQERHVAGAEANAQSSRQELEQTTPVEIAPEPTDPIERAMRLVRNRLHNDVVTFRTSTKVTPLPANSAKNRMNAGSARKTLRDGRR